MCYTPRVLHTFSHSLLTACDPGAPDLLEECSQEKRSVGSRLGQKGLSKGVKSSLGLGCGVERGGGMP